MSNTKEKINMEEDEDLVLETIATCRHLESVRCVSHKKARENLKMPYCDY